MVDLEDTICALSTPPGRSGLAVVRVSGPQAFPTIRKIFQPKKDYELLPARKAILGSIVDPRDTSQIDEAVVTIFQSPGSYTGEDLCELSLHGSPVLVGALLDSLCSLGLRLAEPGEFTMRAFLNGRIDLSQAEAIRDIIDAATLYQAQIAARQRDGLLGKQMRPIKEALIDTIVNLESAVEFAEEDLGTDSRETVMRKLKESGDRLRCWIESFRRGRIIRDGFSMAVVGRPNVGKSSLFNALLAQERSIVTETPGTTRDLVSECTSIGGVPVRLQDTAGIRDSKSMVERLGIERSMQAIADADAVVMVVDSSRAVSKEDVELRERLNGLRCLIAMNKADLPSAWSERGRTEFVAGAPWGEVSAKTMAGVDRLRGMILDQILGISGEPQDGVVVTNLRHCRSLESAEMHIGRAQDALREGLSEEFALADLRVALQSLGEITGETGVEDLLTEIFSRFCVGK